MPSKRQLHESSKIDIAKLVLKICVLATLCYVYADGSVPAIRHALCQEHADVFCKRNAADANIKKNDIIPCCRDCSCESDCGLTQNCCFPEQDSYNSIDRSTHQCLYSITKPSKIYSLSYYMIASCPGKDGKINGNCGDELVAHWGSLHPVYSKSTGRIYKNTKCAECHQVIDGVSWNASYVCDGTDAGFDFSSCVVNFTYPGNPDDEKKERCFPLSTKACQKNYIGQTGIPDTPSQQLQQCANGILSAFNKGNAYINAFCHTCNKDNTTILDDDAQCRTFNLKKVTDGVVFSFIINPNSITEWRYSLEEQGRSMSLPMACKITGDVMDKSTCRIVYCPNRQIRYPNGSCAYLTMAPKVAKPYQIKIKVNLALQKPLPRFALAQITTMTNKLDFTWLSSPWPAPWLIRSMAYETGPANESELNVQMFLVDMRKLVLEFKYADILEEIKNLTTKNWKLRFGQYKTRLKSIPIHSYDVIRRNPLMIPDWKRLRFPATLEYKNRQNVEVTKLYFCKQIKFQETEYEMFNDKIYPYIVIKENGVFLTSDEFKIDSGTVRVCLQDSGFREVAADASSGQMCLTNHIVILFTYFVFAFAIYT